MGIVDRLLGRTEARVAGGNWFAAGFDPIINSAGVKITEENATSIAAVYGAVNLYANTIASMPLGAYIRDRGVRRPVTRPRWFDQPMPNNPNMTGFDFRHRLVSSLLIDGNAFIMVLRGVDGEVVETRVLDPRLVEVRIDPDGTPTYIIGKQNLGADYIVHITLFPTASGRGLSPVEHHRTSLGLAKATETYAAKFFEQGAQVGGIVKVAGELTADQAEQLRSAFARRHEGVSNAHRVAVLTGGADFTPLAMKLTDMDLITQMRWSVENIARIYGVPLHLLQHPSSGMSYASVEVVSIEWLRLGLQSLIARIEAGLQRLIVGDTTFIKFNTDSLLRSTTTERYASYQTALMSGFLSINEVRALEDRPPVEGGDEYWKPLNIGVLGAPPETPAP
jgi:HK97 family phage portal protein